MLLAGRYEVGDLIGRGGMADVYAATDRTLHREVAIKIMRPESGGASDLAARFEDEARVAARLEHPNVVAVFDTGTGDDGRPFIVMERLPGDTLADRIRQGPLPEDHVHAIAGDVLSALGAAHAAGIVHRDVKPGNILRTDDGRAKIADFGIARESDTLLVDPTTTHALTGTPAYIAPERVEGQPATPQSDLWALGVVLYEALTGRKPYDGATPVAVAMAVRDNNHTPLGEARPDIDPALAAAVERAMQRDAADRFATAEAMAAAMDPNATLVADRTVTMAAPAPAAAVAAWWRRFSPRSTGAVAAVAVAVLLLIGIGWATGRSGGGDDTRGADPASVTGLSTTVATTTTTSIPPPAIVITVPVIGNGGDEAPAERRRKGRRGND